MKFITEDDLRYSYKTEPFTTYELEPGTKLTPGARQFLADRGINMFDEEPFHKKSAGDCVIKRPAAPPERKNDWRKKKFHCRMKSMEALFLLAGRELLDRDVVLSQKVMDLGRQFSSIKNAAAGKGTVSDLCCQGCTGIHGDNFADDLEDCFEITEFHMQVEKGKEIAILHRLRCELREVEPTLMEVFGDAVSEEESKLCGEIIGKVNQIVNTLSQMICLAFGGKTCQKRD